MNLTASLLSVNKICGTNDARNSSFPHSFTIIESDKKKSLTTVTLCTKLDDELSQVSHIRGNGYKLQNCI